MFKKASAFIICLTLCIVAMVPFSVSAADSHKIEVTSLTAVPGDTVTISVDMTENTGIMAMSFTLCYDKDAFTFQKFKIGVFSDYTIVPHQDKGYISVVILESKNKRYKGVIFSAEFTVNEKATPGKHDFKIRHIYPDQRGDDLKGCFAVSTADNKGTYPVIPEITHGSVTVGETCSNSPHIFSDFTVTAQPTCEEAGVKSRSCSRCGHIENQTVAAKGHDFEDAWTIDKEATDTAAGSMSRHCKNCSKATDVIPFFKENAEDDGFENKEDETITEDDSDYIKDKVEELEQEKNESNNDNNDNTDNGDDGFTPDTDTNTEPDTDSSQATQNGDDNTLKEGFFARNKTVILCTVTALAVVFAAVIILLLFKKKGGK